jgi:hypothetical protein
MKTNTHVSPPPARPRARAAWSRLSPVRKNGTYNPPINRTSVGDEYGAGNPEVRCGSYRQITRTGGKRDFSPCVYRGLGERSTRVREYAQREKSWWTLFGLTTKAGKSTVLYSISTVCLKTRVPRVVPCLGFTVLPGDRFTHSRFNLVAVQPVRRKF